MGAVTWPYIFAVTIVAVGASFQFYSFGVVNPTQEILEKWINQTYLVRNGKGFSRSLLTFYWAFLSSSIAIGAFLGSMLTKPLAETCGRRNGLIANGIVNVFGGLFEGISKGTQSPELLILGRFILGANMGLTSGLAPLYLMEITPIRYRGAAGTAHQIAVAFGDWFSLFLAMPQIFGGADLWPSAFAFPGIPALLLVILLPWFPESPRFSLISLGQRDEAEHALKVFVGRDNCRAAFDALVKEAAVSKVDSSQVSIRSLFAHKHTRTPLRISILVMIAQQFTGCAAVFAYSTDIFIKAKLSPDTARYATLAIGICYFLFVLPSTYLIERWGRRFLSLFQLSGCCVTLVLLTIFISLQNVYGYDWASYGCIASLVLYMCIYGLGSPIPWLITSELFAQEHRSAAVSVSTFTAWFWAFVVSIGYLPFQQAVGISLSFLPFIVVLFISIIFMALLLPETKNRTIDDIIAEFKERSRTISRTITFTTNMTRPSATVPELERLLEEDENETPVKQPNYGTSPSFY